MSVRILTGDCRARLAELPDESVHCCVTSPPYFGLRDYGTAKWEGGDAACDHVAFKKPPTVGSSSTLGYPSDGGPRRIADGNNYHEAYTAQFLAICGKCGGRRIDNQIGLEPTPDAYVAELVAVFREVRRVLRKDGTLWLNLGTSYVSGYIESHEYVIRSDITTEERQHALESIAAAITASVSTVRRSDAPTERQVSSVPSINDRTTNQLCAADLPEVRKGFHRPQDARGTWTSEVLQQELCKVREPYAQERNPGGRLSDVRQAVQQIPCGDQEESRSEALLLGGLLVQPQCQGQSLSVDGRSAREDEPGRREVAQGCDDARQVALPDLPCNPQTGGSPYSPVRNSQRTALGNSERSNTLSHLSRSVSPPRIRARRNPVFHSIGPGDGLEKIAIPKSAIPPDVLHLFQPRHISKPKDDALVPEQVALALRDDGWIIRQTIIWSKPNPMPESVADRCTKSHEYLFMLAKSERYYFDAEAIAETGVVPSGTRRTIGKPKQNGMNRAEAFGMSPMGNEANGYMTVDGTRNRRSVWTVATQPFPEAHFATFPPDLIEPCIKAGTSEKGCCAKCGKPWRREVERTTESQGGSGKAGRTADEVNASGKWAGQQYGTNIKLGPVVSSRTTGWSPSCSCDAAVVPCTVLDPFGGAGTTGLVADRLGRNAILIELNPEYASMAHRRIVDDAPLFAEAAE